MEQSLDRAEFDKLTLLMKEYTEKLRSICEERLDTRFKRIQAAGITTAVTAGVFSLSFVWLEKISDSSRIISSMSTLILVVMVLVIMIVLTFIVNTRSLRYSYDSERLAATVERLIRLASQYNEHAQRKVSDRFELDLRIAEAEGALSLYQKVFNVDRDWKSKD